MSSRPEFCPTCGERWCIRDGSCKPLTETQPAVGTPRPIVIVESPYQGDVARNERYLDACLRDSLRRGEAPFASHGLYTRPGVLRDSDPVERELGIQTGFAFRRAAAFTVVYTDLGISDGMRRGIEDAQKIGGAVEFRQLEGEWKR